MPLILLIGALAPIGHPRHAQKVILSASVQRER